MKLTSTPAPQLPDLSSLCLAITEHAPLPMATVEGASHIVRYVNPAFCLLIGKPKEQLVGKPYCEMLPEKDECLKVMDRVFRTGKPENHTEQEHSKPHPVFWSYTMWPVLAEEQTIGVMIQVTETAQFHEKMLAMNEALMLGSVRQHELTEASENLNAQLGVEIAERKRTEEALHRAKTKLTDRAGQLEGLVAERTRELTSTNEQLEAFVHTIAHDLRAPLRSMQGFSEMLVEEAGTSLNETCCVLARRISTSALFMDAMLIDLLTFSSIAQQQVKLTSVDLKSVVQEVLSGLEKEVQEKNARMETVGAWPEVLAHEPTLRQVLTNLISNALKFVPPDVPPQIRIWTEETNLTEANKRNPQGNVIALPSVKTFVQDNGVGIAPNQQEEIFGLFTRLNGKNFPGTGIGLAIVKKGIERMGGRVGVESTPGQGSRFWFELRKA